MDSKRLFRALLVCLALLTFPAAIAWAGPYDTIESSSPQTVVDAMATKAARGIANITTGWWEIPKQIHLSATEVGGAKGIFIGPLRGLGMAVVRTVSGAGELATFFVAYPGFYDAFLDPAFVWQEE